MTERCLECGAVVEPDEELENGICEDCREDAEEDEVVDFMNHGEIYAK